MKNLTRLLCCTLLPGCLISGSGISQKVDLDRYNIHCSFKDLPGKPLGDNYNTYSVEVGAPGNVLNSISPNTIDNAVGIRGLKKVTANPSFILYFNAEDMYISDVGVKEYVDIKKDDKGNEKSRKTSYYVQATYSLKCEGKCYTDKKELVYSAALGVSQKQYTSDYMNTYKEAADYWNNNKEAIRKNLTADIINGAVTSMSNRLSADYGYVPHSGYDILWILNSKKHPEHEAQQSTIAKVKEEFAKMKADSSIDWLVRDMDSVLQYFNDVAARYNKDEKGDKKMRYGAYYNRAVIYTYLDMPDKAIAEADKLIANGYDSRDGERLKKNADILKAMLERNHKTTTHFTN